MSLILILSFMNLHKQIYLFIIKYREYSCLSLGKSSVLAPDPQHRKKKATRPSVESGDASGVTPPPSASIEMDPP